MGVLQYKITFLSLVGKGDLFIKWCWHNWLFIILAVCAFWVYLVSDSFLVLLLCSEYRSWAQQAAFSCLPWQMVWLGSCQWEAMAYIQIARGKEKIRCFSASHPQQLLHLSIFILQLLYNSLGNPVSIKKNLSTGNS